MSVLVHHKHSTRLGRCALVLLTAAYLSTALPARAQSEVSELSALSLLPVAVSVAAPVVVLSAGAVLTVKAVEVSGRGTVWVVERASDGARASIRFTGQAVAVAGTAVLVTAVSTGWVLSAASTAIAFIPNELGRALLHDERITR